MRFRSITPRRRIALLATSFLAVTGLVGLGIFVTPGPADAADNGAWSVFPTSPPGQFFPRPYFEPLLRPGVPVHDSVTITNKTAQPLNFDLYAADAFNTIQGQFALRLRTDPKRDIGAWIQLPLHNLTLSAHTSVNIPFTINPPADAPPGDHAGGIIAENTVPIVSHNGNINIARIHAVGVRIYARVAGPLEPGLQITALRITSNTGLAGLFGGGVGVTVRYTVVNTGNVRLDPKAVLSLSPLVGGAEHRPAVVPELLPRGSATVSEHFSSVDPFGDLHAHVSVAAAGAQASASSTAWIVPWLLVLVVALLIAGLAFWYRRHRRGGSQTLSEPGDGPQGGEAAPGPREVART
jgi:hypothetical protein